MHGGDWFTFGLGHWLYGVVFWGLVIFAIVSIVKNFGGKDD